MDGSLLAPTRCPREAEKTAGDSKMTSVIDGLLFCWEKNRDYGHRLVADLNDQQMVLQPAPADSAPTNHPAWVFSHLNAYLPVVESLIRGVSFADPKLHRFGMDSQPEADASIYAPRDELMAEYEKGHRQVADLLVAADDSLFDQQVNLDRWQTVMPTLGLALPYIMMCHENMHLGQLSTWRRVQGMPSV